MTNNLAAKQFARYSDYSPLIKLSDRLYAKLEAYNPTGSIKDRMVAYVIGQAQKRGEINEDTLLVEATSGNTGIALASLGAALGNPVQVVMPCNMSDERKQMMRMFGATIVEVAASDFDAAIKKRDEILASVDNSWTPDQFANPDNIDCHRYITGPAIFHQIPINAKWSAFVSGAGTGGTITGVKRYTDSHPKLDVSFVLVVPAEDSDKHGIQGIGDGSDFLVDRNEMDHIVRIKTEDAKDRARRLAKETGLLVGISSGANVLAAERYIDARTLSHPDDTGLVITILPDRGERYMSVL